MDNARPITGIVKPRFPQPPLAWDTRQEEMGDVEQRFLARLLGAEPETGIWVHRICGGKRE